MSILEIIESREFDLAGWNVMRHPAFVRIYDGNCFALFTLKKSEFYDNTKGCCFTIKKVKDALTREIEKEGSLDKREVLSAKLEALEYAEDLTDKLD